MFFDKVKPWSQYIVLIAAAFWLRQRFPAHWKSNAQDVGPFHHSGSRTPVRNAAEHLEMTMSSLRGVMPYVGGKRNLATRIIQRINLIPHQCYAEPFVGAGGVFLRRSLRATSEAINDRNAEVSNLFRMLQRHPEAVLQQISFGLTSRKDFERLQGSNPAELTDLERAARLVAIQYQSYGGRPDASFAISPLRRARYEPSRLLQFFRSVHARLAGVYIDCLDFSDFIHRWDRPSTLFYIDPPYYRCEDYYGEGLFVRGDFERLASALMSIQGRFLLSLNDTPEVREIFGAFEMEVLPTTYRLGGTAKPVSELLISN